MPGADRTPVTFAVVIPMYNEETGAERCVRAVCKELALFPDSRLIVVDDGSADSTGAILDNLAPRFSALIPLHHARNTGYGAALKTGVEKAWTDGFDYVLFMDSDLTNDPSDIARFVDRMEQGFDVIKASRYCAGGGVEGVPAARYWISRIGNAVARLLYRLPVKDATNGFRAIRVGIIRAMDLKENGFPIIMEELYHSRYAAASFCNVPVVLKNRASHLRQTSFHYRPAVFGRYLKYPLRSLLPHRSQSGGIQRRAAPNDRYPIESKQEKEAT